MWLRQQTVSSLERCLLFRVSFIDRFPCRWIIIYLKVLPRGAEKLAITYIGEDAQLLCQCVSKNCMQITARRSHMHEIAFWSENCLWSLVWKRQSGLLLSVGPCNSTSLKEGCYAPVNVKGQSLVKAALLHGTTQGGTGDKRQKGHSCT